MHARSSTFQASTIDAGIANVADSVMPALMALDGCVGLSLLVDRESGRCIATSAWQTEDAMRASAGAADGIRDSAASAFGAASGGAEVAEWEIAVLHRDHRSGAGACVRATWFKLPNGRAPIDLYRDTVLPALEEFDGFCSASLMISRASGLAVSSVTLDSRAALDNSREQARSLRTARLRELGADQVDVGEFELALAHLRVPELI